MPAGAYVVQFIMPGFVPMKKEVVLRDREVVQVDQMLTVAAASETITAAAEPARIQAASGERSFNVSGPSAAPTATARARWAPHTASYAAVRPNSWVRTADDPRSTLAADVDTASYTNVRRFLNRGTLPPVEAVRVEEFINYFSFDYPEPPAGEAIGLTSEVGECPWAPGHKLGLIGTRAKGAQSDSPGRNFVFLVDVSGSMAPDERLPLIKSSLALLVDALGVNRRRA